MNAGKPRAGIYFGPITLVLLSQDLNHNSYRLPPHHEELWALEKTQRDQPSTPGSTGLLDRASKAVLVLPTYILRSTFWRSSKDSK